MQHYAIQNPSLSPVLQAPFVSAAPAVPMCSHKSASLVTQKWLLVSIRAYIALICMYVQHGFNVTCCFTVEYMTIQEVMYKNGTIKEHIMRMHASMHIIRGSRTTWIASDACSLIGSSA